jgi:hypothetical protein
MTSTNQTSSGAKANLVSSSPELLTRPASKPDDRPNSSTGELCTCVAQPEAVPPTFPFVCFVYFVIKQVPNHKHFPCDFPTRNQFPTLNLAAIFSLQHLALSLCTCSACSAYHFEKNAETTAETALRFAEASQQTLREISLLPTTYNNFAEKNALKSKLLRLLRLDRSLAGLPFHSRPPFGARTALSARHFRNTRNTPKTHARHTRNTLKNTVETHEFLRQTHRNTQNTLFFLRGAQALSLRPSTLNSEISQPLLAPKQARKWHVNWHVQIFKNPSKTRKLARKTHSFFSSAEMLTATPRRRRRTPLRWPVRPAQRIKVRACFQLAFILRPISRREINFPS